MIAQKNIVVRATNLFWVSAVLICGGIMFYVSLEARHAEEQLYRTYAETKQEEENIKILKAEIAYLTNPDRLQALANKYLPLHETNQEQFASLNVLEDRPVMLVSSETLNNPEINEAVAAMLAPAALKAATPQLPQKKDTQVASQVTKSTFNALLLKISDTQE